MKNIIRILILVLMIMVIGIIGYTIVFEKDIMKMRTVKPYSSIEISNKIAEISELATYKYEYADVIISKTRNEKFGVNLPFSETIKLIKYQGYIKVGTDFSKIQLSVDDDTKTMRVKIPKSHVIDNVVDTEQTTVEDIKGEILSEYPTQYIFDEINIAKNALKNKVLKDGLLEESDKRLILILQSFLKSYGYEKIEFDLY
ncbi:DUF4230 domain-containing protein [Petroclostridium sp. X23]|uniref:DUF4230 domain-containing protein n=1 Tax=Petroclostridium sp. X23 TaxID=3045146 RepID=UPI0024AD9611|nr:DUF4230 domain-containing protein [Petroclostridium sp. X23]WHH60094.1 DUF4230 domain-containing protein [Petroclostridium sp. X23]